MTPSSMAKHGTRKHNKYTIKIARKQSHCPLCNKEYSNLTPLLIHLLIRQTPMTWQPTTCNILKKQITKPDQDNIKEKWEKKKKNTIKKAKPCKTRQTAPG